MSAARARRLPIALTAALAATAACNRNEGKVALPEKPAAAPVAAPVADPAPAAQEQENAQEQGQVHAQEQAPASAPTPGATVATRLTGQVTAQRSSKIGFEVTGFIATAVAKPGTIAKKGDILATLQDEDFELRVQLARARRDQARIQAETAKSDFEREQQLKKDNASTSAAFEKIQAQYESARLAQRLAELDLTAAERALADTKLRAPYDCVVAAQTKFDGENVQIGNAVFEIVDMSDPEITFEAPERLFGRIGVGDTVNVLVPSTGFRGKAQVVRTVPVIAERTRTFRVITRPTETAKNVVPGVFAEATIN